jgi:hypothetical protein
MTFPSRLHFCLSEAAWCSQDFSSGGFNSLLKKPALDALGSEFLVIDELFGSC